MTANILKEERKTRMLQSGKHRERYMHRFPHCLMDQMVSGSHFFPPSLMPGELLPDEQKKVQQLANLPILQATKHANHLALDLMSYVLYDVETVIILDNSGSMAGNMFGDSSYYSYGNINLSTGYCAPNFVYAPTEMRYRTGFSEYDSPEAHTLPQDPRQTRWQHAHYTLTQWRSVFRALGVKVKIITLNPVGMKNEFGLDDLDDIFAYGLGGGTPLTEAIAQAVTGVRMQYGNSANSNNNNTSSCCPYGACNPTPPPPPANNTMGKKNRHLQILMLTDGEATNMLTFNQILDATQNKQYDDVQICILGLTLQPKDIEWMENEECEHIRVRAIEAFEIEQFQIKNRLVAYKEGNYNYPMHIIRALLTNIYPSEFDFEAPAQTLRHRCYITMHSKDRWWSQKSACYGIPSCLVGIFCCTPLYCATCGCGLGYCQGQECGKCRPTECLENFSCSEE